MLSSFYFIGNKSILILISLRLSRARMRTVLSSILFILKNFLCVTWSHATVWKKELPQVQLIGSGEFRWFGLPVYGAKLWSMQLLFDTRAIFALELTYRRKISRQQLVKVCTNKIKWLFNNRYAADKLQSWESGLSHAFSDVSEEDQLIGIFLPGYSCHFYNQKNLLAEIADPEIAQAFFYLAR